MMEGWITLQVGFIQAKAVLGFPRRALAMANSAAGRTGRSTTLRPKKFFENGE